MAGYVDLYLLPIPVKNAEAYRAQANTFGDLALEHGALLYREFKGDDFSDGGDSLLKAAPIDDGEMLTAALMEFESRAHRDEVMKILMADPRMKALEEQGQIADMSKMRYGGFEVFIEAKQS